MFCSSSDSEFITFHVSQHGGTLISVQFFRRQMNKKHVARDIQSHTEISAPHNIKGNRRFNSVTSFLEAVKQASYQSPAIFNFDTGKWKEPTTRDSDDVPSNFVRERVQRKEDPSSANPLNSEFLGLQFNLAIQCHCFVRITFPSALENRFVPDTTKHPHRRHNIQHMCAECVWRLHARVLERVFLSCVSDSLCVV